MPECGTAVRSPDNITAWFDEADASNWCTFALSDLSSEAPR